MDTYYYHYCIIILHVIVFLSEYHNGQHFVVFVSWARRHIRQFRPAAHNEDTVKFIATVNFRSYVEIFKLSMLSKMFVVKNKELDFVFIPGVCTITDLKNKQKLYVGFGLSGTSISMLAIGLNFSGFCRSSIETTC